MAHPDDAEIYAGGTIARLVKEGKTVRVVKMTLGNRGCGQQKISERELAKIRMAEDQKAMAILGIKPEDNIYLGINDGEVENSLETIGKLARQIRLFKPDIILTQNPEEMIIRFDDDDHWVNHRDHLNTAKAAINAAYPYSRDLLFFSKQFKEKGVTSHTVIEFLLGDYYNHPETIYIQVSEEQAEIRSRAQAAHKSQYTLEQAKSSTDFFTKHPSGKRFERFRYVKAD
jgi:LmbE family N-acetylglucosaminyl deacetylase